MPEALPFAYAVLRVVPCLERGERLNVGVALFCRQYDFLEMKVEMDAGKLRSLAPDADAESIRQRLDSLCQVVSGNLAGGSLASMDPSDRFGWLVAPSSTIIQASRVHTGLTGDPAAELDRLFRTLVL
ncbi:MAG: DUF3037 domain-containing protein [Solirubrobacterales bacterium]